MNRDEIKNGVVYVTRYDVSEEIYVVFVCENKRGYGANWVRSGGGWDRHGGGLSITDNPIIEAAGSEEVF